MKVLLAIVIFLSGFCMNTSASDDKGRQGLTIQLDAKKHSDTQGIYLSGSFSVFVNCGSQYAIWGQFPQVINYKLKDLESGVIYTSINREMSISWNGNSVYEEYSHKPCNQIISEEFVENLQDLYFTHSPKHSITRYSVQADYMGFVSDWLTIENKPIRLKSF